MSASKNADAMNSKQGEFRSRVAPSEPLTTKGVSTPRRSLHHARAFAYIWKHAPGVLVGNDRKPEFHAETHPPGTAPAEASFQANPDVGEAPGHYNAQYGIEGIPGATSKDVHTGLGHPGSGMTSKEAHGGKRERGGKELPSGMDMEDSAGSRKLDGHEKTLRTAQDFL